MRNKKAAELRQQYEAIPQFEAEEQEAEYWDTQSPLDLIAEPKVQRLYVRGSLDRLLTIRLDSESRLKLDRLAAKHGVGPSTFARLALMSVIEHGEKPPKLGKTMRRLLLEFIAYWYGRGRGFPRR